MRFAVLVATLAIGVTGCSAVDDPESDEQVPQDEQTTQSEQEASATTEQGVTTSDVEVTTEAAPDEGEVAEETGEPGDGQAAPGMSSSERVGAPEDEIGHPVAIDPILVEGDGAVVAMTGITAYSTGMQVQVAVRTDPGETQEGAAQPDDPMGERGRPSPQPDPEDELPEELLRIEVRYPDGGIASSVEGPEPQAEPEGPVLAFESSQSSGAAWDYEFWLWPLPESDDEDLEVVLEWPAQGIDVSEPIDAARIDAAVGQVTTLWED